MDFFNEAVRTAKEENIELNDVCKELFLAVSHAIQDMDLREQRDFLAELLAIWELD